MSFTRAVGLLFLIVGVIVTTVLYCILNVVSSVSWTIRNARAYWHLEFHSIEGLVVCVSSLVYVVLVIILGTSLLLLLLLLLQLPPPPLSHHHYFRFLLNPSSHPELLQVRSLTSKLLWFECFSTGRMHFPSSNRQHRSTEGKVFEDFAAWTK